jgi:endoglucanase
MFMQNKILLAALLFCCAFAGAADSASAQTLIRQGFDKTQEGPGKIIDLPARPKVLEITNADATTSVLRSLPVTMSGVPGSPIQVNCDVQGENISAKPDVWNGIKLMAHIQFPGGESWPEANLPVGSFGWRHVSIRFQIPDNATAVTLILGLEKVTGTVRFSGLSISLATKFVQAASAPPDQPIFKGHDVPRLRGAMVAPTLSREDLANFAEQWKGNLIRWQLFRDNPAVPESDFVPYDKWLDQLLLKTDLVLTWAKQDHVKVVVDLHSPPGGKFPSTGSLFIDHRAQDHFLEVWQKIAQRYKGNPTIWGFDLVNEPNDDQTAADCMDWQALSLAAGKVVRKIDPDRTLIVEPPKNGSASGWEYFNPLPLPRVVYSFHFYDPIRFTHQRVFNPADSPVSYPGEIDGEMWNRDTLLKTMQPAIDFARRYRVHMYIGEFSAIRWAPGADLYLADAISIFEDQGWDWSYHAYREWPGWNLELGTDESSMAPSPVPTARFNAVEKWLKENQRPN